MLNPTSLFTLLASLASPTTALCQLARNPAAQDQELAHPRVKDAAGPYPSTTLTLWRTRDQPTAPFAGVLHTATGKRLTLAGPDEPDGFFYLDVKAVIFTPIDRTRTNGIVILYNSSRIGPQNGTDRRALVYRVEKSRTVRQPVLERRLEGVANAAQARVRLAAARR